MIGLNAAKWHLRIDGTADDAELDAKINMATAIVRQYIGDLRGDHLRDPADLDDLKSVAAAGIDARRLRHQEAIDAAILLVLGELWANREAGTSNPLSDSVRLILGPVREIPLA